MLKAAVYKAVLSCYKMLLPHHQSTKEIHGKEKVLPDLDHGQVSIQVDRSSVSTTDPNYQQIASRIFIATNKTWRSQQEAISHTATCDATTLASPSDTNSRRASSRSVDMSECAGEDGDQGVSVIRVLKPNTANLEQQLFSKHEALDALEKEYTKQRRQRLRDKALVDQAYQEVLRMETHCKEVQEAHKRAEQILQDKLYQQRSQINAKNEELVKLIDQHHFAVDTLEQSHAADLYKLHRKAAEERRQTEAAHLNELRTLTAASKTNRSAWEKTKQSMKTEMKRMERDFQDGLQANENEITRLTELSYRLAAENRLLASALDQIPRAEMRERANEVFEEVRHAREELDKTQTKLKIANEKIENILEGMQQERDHWEAHGANEKQAQAQIYDLQKYIIELQEKLKLRDNLLRAVNISKGTTTTTVTAENVPKAAFDNDELQAKLRAAKEENLLLQANFNKVDDENCALCMKLDTTEADLHKAKERLRMLEHKQTLINKEHELLYAAVENHEGLTSENKHLLQKHLQETTAVNNYLRGRNDELRNELTKAKEFVEVVEDKCNLEVDKASKYAEFWELMYWDEAVPKVERLSQEIHELNKELGRNNVYVQERLERNVVVADRNALRYACKYSLRGVDPELIPAEVYEPGFVPGWIPATHDALRTLRPLGWVPVAELGKVWLAPMFKPFTQEDAAYRLRAKHQQERKEHRARMNASPPPEADPEEPFDASSSKSSSRGADSISKPYEELEVPAYNSEWMNIRSELTREAYEDMDTDLKLGVLRMIGVELSPKSNREEELF
ncbi:uncharacterized protein yc1106_02989 [Curvularia clavata]|uniref:Uncharacterized protein n=1 Tax=Curvularia clavata TaxID=95742 RepID=A0A9Q9DR57_CURCL|nr:uncharacterized protein yc1106_02989 [Curvularia clavata]